MKKFKRGLLIVFIYGCNLALFTLVFFCGDLSLERMTNLAFIETVALSYILAYRFGNWIMEEE